MDVAASKAKKQGRQKENLERLYNVQYPFENCVLNAKHGRHSRIWDQIKTAVISLKSEKRPGIDYR